MFAADYKSGSADAVAGRLSPAIWLTLAGNLWYAPLSDEKPGEMCLQNAFLTLTNAIIPIVRSYPLSDFLIHVLALVLKTLLRVGLFFLAMHFWSWELSDDTVAALLLVIALCTDIQN